MKKTLLLILVLTITSTLVLSGCTTPETDTPDTDPTTDVVTPDTPEEPEVTGPVPFSMLEESMLYAGYDNENPDGYKSFDFKEGGGTCIDQGFPKEWSYYHDEELGYFVIKSTDETYFNDWVSLTFTGYMGFGNMPLTDGMADCNAVSTVGEDIATVSCTLEEVEGEEVEDEEEKEVVCAGTFQLYAVK